MAELQATLDRLLDNQGDDHVRWPEQPYEYAKMPEPLITQNPDGTSGIATIKLNGGQDYFLFRDPENADNIIAMSVADAHKQAVDVASNYRSLSAKLDDGERTALVDRLNLFLDPAINDIGQREVVASASTADIAALSNIKIHGWEAPEQAPDLNMRRRPSNPAAVAPKEYVREERVVEADPDYVPGELDLTPQIFEDPDEEVLAEQRKPVVEEQYVPGEISLTPQIFEEDEPKTEVRESPKVAGAELNNIETAAGVPSRTETVLNAALNIMDMDNTEMYKGVGMPDEQAEACSLMQNYAAFDGALERAIQVMAAEVNFADIKHALSMEAGEITIDLDAIPKTHELRDEFEKIHEHLENRPADLAARCEGVAP